jgi:hypothetical protein
MDFKFLTQDDWLSKLSKLPKTKFSKKKVEVLTNEIENNRGARHSTL